MKITRRPAQDSDRAFARDVHRQSYHDVVVRQFGQYEEKAQDGFFEKAWTVGPHEILLCDGVPCGYVGIERPDGFVRIRELVVLPAFQGRGIGSFVLKEAIVEAGSKGVPVRLNVLHMNKAAELYKRYGFAEYGRNETHVLMECIPRMK